MKKLKSILLLLIIIIAKNFPNLARIPNKINPKTSMLKHIIIKLLKTTVKENILIAARKKTTPYLWG